MRNIYDVLTKSDHFFEVEQILNSIMMSFYLTSNVQRFQTVHNFRCRWVNSLKCNDWINHPVNSLIWEDLKYLPSGLNDQFIIYRQSQE